MDGRQKFEEKMKRIDDALAVREPDKVPMIPFVQTYSITHAGHTMAEAMYDAQAAKDSVQKYLTEYDPDGNYGYSAFFCGLGPMMDKLGVKFLQWAGGKDSICTENSIHQFVEKPYLEDEEYPELLSDLSGWIMKKYLPRNLEIMKPLASVNFTGMFGFGAVLTAFQFANPEIAEMFVKLGEIAAEGLPVMIESGNFDREMAKAGYPLLFNATTTVAFDQLSDCLRGTLDTMTDLYERPDEVKRAIELFYPGSFYGALAQAQNSPGKLVFIPLHKGLEGFMSNPQYAEFYWPTLKRLVDDLIAAGHIPYVYTEGKYDARLEFLKDLPAGKCLVHFEDCDMKEAKRLVGDHCCICGGFDDQLLVKETPEKVRDEVKKLLDICAPGGGYMFDVNCTIDDGAKPENVEAMFETVREYGVY